MYRYQTGTASAASLPVDKAGLLKTFRLHGYSLNVDAVKYLCDTLKSVTTPTLREKVVQKIITSISNRASQLDSNLISKEICEVAVRDCRTERSDDIKLLQVINAFERVRFVYVKEQRKFLPITKAQEDAVSIDAELNGEALDCVASTSHRLHMCSGLLSPWPNERTRQLRQRYYLLMLRLHRHRLFFTPLCENVIMEAAISANAGAPRFSLSLIESLLSCSQSSSALMKVIVLGMLVQLREGQWYLEDPTGCVQLDLTNAVYHDGLFLEGSMILVEGRYEDKVLIAKVVGHPPSEARPNPLATTGSTGAPSMLDEDAIAAINEAAHISSELSWWAAQGLTVPLYAKLHRLCHNTPAGTQAMLVCLSDVWLDSAAVWSRLQYLFHAYDPERGGAMVAPMGFILAGDFLTPDQWRNRQTADKMRELQRHLPRLVQLFMRHFGTPSSENGSRTTQQQAPQLILVPGPHDPISSGQLLHPRAPLGASLFPGVLSEEAKNQVRLATSPCRLRLYHREVVLLRASRLVTSLARHSLRLPNLEETPESQGEETLSRAALLQNSVAKTLACQAHLMPLSAHVAPVFPAWDQALWIHPLPDVVFLADEQQLRFQTQRQSDCQFANPGSFSAQRSFQVYYPHTNVIEDCHMPEQD